MLLSHQLLIFSVEIANRGADNFLRIFYNAHDSTSQQRREVISGGTDERLFSRFKQSSYRLSPSFIVQLLQSTGTGQLS